jgi:type I restriction enzyme S subunit
MTHTAQASLFPAKQPSVQEPWPLPSGWEWVPLGELCKAIVGGGTPDRGNPRYWGGNILWASVKDLKSDELASTQESITPEGLENSAARVVEPGTIVLATRMGLGKVCVAQARLAINQDLKGLILRSNVLSQYVVFFLKSRASDIEGRGTGATVKGVKLEELKAWPVPVPFPQDHSRSLDIQRHIVTQIETLLAEVKEARALAAAIRRDTDRIMGAALEEVISEIPTSRRPLLEVLEGKPRNGWSPQCDNDPTGTPVLKLGAVLGFRFNPSAVKRTSLPVDSRAHYWLTKGDILISRSNTPDLVGHAAICSGEPYPCIYPDLLMKMRARPTEANPQFVVYWLQCKEARAYVQAHASGASSTMKKITQGDVCFLPFPKVGIEEQRRVVAHLDVVQNEIDEMRRLQAQDAELLDQLEQSILERAFRGEL